MGPLLRARGGRVVSVGDGRDRYKPYRVFIGTTRAEGAVQIGLGETIRKNKWGRDRKYVVAFLSSGSPNSHWSSSLQPTTTNRPASWWRSSVAATGGDGCTGSVTPFRPPTPNAFERRSTTSGSSTRAAWNKVVVVAREDEDEAILNHALIQSRRRYRT